MRKSPQLKCAEAPKSSRKSTVVLTLHYRLYILLKVYKRQEFLGLLVEQIDIHFLEQMYRLCIYHFDLSDKRL